MSNVDDIFWRRFGMLLGLLILFGVIVAFIARDIAGDAFESTINTPSAIAQRIAPAGSVRVGDPTQVVAATPPAAAVAAATTATPAPAGDASADGESVYNGACVACHLAGVAGAPKLGDEAAWAPLIALGEGALVMSVANGKGAMPAKGGNPALSEDQIRAAVKYMLEKAGGGGGTASQAMEKEAPAATAAKATVTAAVTEAQGKASAAMTGAAEAAKGMADKAAQTTGSAGAAAMTAATPATSSVASAAAGKPGDQVYNMACVACHATGVANAPKLTDKAAWETRAGVGGMAALVSSVVDGKGAMPAKGGMASLTEADLQNAVRYMLKEAGVEAGS